VRVQAVSIVAPVGNDEGAREPNPIKQLGHGGQIVALAAALAFVDRLLSGFVATAIMTMAGRPPF
jgi:hypothetical protein